MTVLNNVRGALITIPWLIQLLIADLLLSLLLPISSIFPVITYDISSVLAYSVWRVIQAVFEDLNGAEIFISGSTIPRHESAIVVANHIGWTDFYMIQALAIRSQMLGRCRWFAKQQLRWVPFLGWGLWAMGMPLVSRNWLHDKREMDSVFGKIRNDKRPVWLISYSEATRFTQEKYEEALNWCKAHDRKIPKNTLYPRTRGFVAQVTELRKSEHVKAVYDCTIAYARAQQFLEAPDMWETMSSPTIGTDYQFRVHVDRYPLDELPEHEGELASWLEEKWIEKGERLEQWKRNFARTGGLKEAA